MSALKPAPVVGGCFPSEVRLEAASLYFKTCCVDRFAVSSGKAKILNWQLPPALARTIVSIHMQYWHLGVFLAGELTTQRVAIDGDHGE